MKLTKDEKSGFVPSSTLRGKIYDNIPVQMHSIGRVIHSAIGNFHMLPDFYIAGVERAGTTTMYDYLQKHPDICPPITKEIGFFNKLYNMRNLNWYRSRFPTLMSRFAGRKFFHNAGLTYDSTVYYFTHPHVPTRIHTVTPNAKFIFMFRNPVYRAYSAYHMHRRYQGESISSFEQAIDLEPQRILGEYDLMKKNKSYYSWNYQFYAYCDVGIYVKHLKHWIEKFDKKQMLFLQSEQMERDPDSFYKKVTEFLGIKTVQYDTYSKENKGVYKDDMNSETKKRLSEFFAPYNEELYSIIDERYDWD